MIWSRHSGWGIHCDIVNPKLFELEVAKEILGEIYGIQISEVNVLIGQNIVDIRLMDWSLGNRMSFDLTWSAPSGLQQRL